MPARFKTDTDTQAAASLIAQVKAGRQEIFTPMGMTHEILGAAEYIRGVASTLPDPNRLRQIADLLDSVNLLFNGVDVEDTPGAG